VGNSPIYGFEAKFSLRFMRVGGPVGKQHKRKNGRKYCLFGDWNLEMAIKSSRVGDGQETKFEKFIYFFPQRRFTAPRLGLSGAGLICASQPFVGPTSQTSLSK
jgi:hypothetical protein